jgi:hypothetical protein
MTLDGRKRLRDAVNDLAVKTDQILTRRTNLHVGRDIGSRDVHGLSLRDPLPQDVSQK